MKSSGCRPRHGVGTAVAAWNGAAIGGKMGGARNRAGKRRGIGRAVRTRNWRGERNRTAGRGVGRRREANNRRCGCTGRAGESAEAEGGKGAAPWRFAGGSRREGAALPIAGPAAQLVGDLSCCRCLDVGIQGVDASAGARALQGVEVSRVRHRGAACSMQAEGLGPAGMGLGAALTAEAAQIADKLVRRDWSWAAGCRPHARPPARTGSPNCGHCQGAVRPLHCPEGHPAQHPPLERTRSRLKGCTTRRRLGPPLWPGDSGLLAVSWETEPAVEGVPAGRA